MGRLFPLLPGPSNRRSGHTWKPRRQEREVPRVSGITPVTSATLARMGPKPAKLQTVSGWRSHRAPHTMPKAGDRYVTIVARSGPAR